VSETGAPKSTAICAADRPETARSSHAPAFGALGHIDRHRLIDGDEALEAGRQTPDGAPASAAARESIQRPEQHMDAMHGRRTGRSAARDHGVEVHRIAIAGNRGEAGLIGHVEG
jgi:hypothetical protein